ncbi:HK97 family phage prohead protease [Clostridium botulinum]|uniref:HK97 family phage prohead protease n=1 Tax=Clostridium botulinum TaxID=1491 RepID=A0A6G4H4B8_CLOBO|nr:HK97 family phage prohead protease [Clostridium botulinum]MBY6842251.1 HK97 family phage prohead protease [Clostridium botulinum]MBY6844494.1 HK97 family phage prohead protease [Clostridium botulinum]NFH35959.1 HK97 family phage prohead protease [Clostridium botulinum]NFU28486.1 HK97 family phage prohead protease [Clostridium botulinum]NFV06976.1 HK97 family phage prohead protease [Clostridium botulinum]
MEMEQNKLGNTHEVRTVNILNLETRSEGDNGNKIVGYAAVYDEFTRLTDRWGDYFYEKISRDAAKESLEDGHEIFALKNHNWDMVLGRTDANLTLKNDEQGIYFELTPNNSTLANDLKEDVKSGIIKQCSIGFRILDQEWEEKEGEYFRVIKQIELFEITLTPIPAYTNTTAEVRSLNSSQNQDEKNKINTRTADLNEQEERSIILKEARNQINEIDNYFKL